MTLYLSHFFYTVNGGFMTVCIDGVLFLKFYLDFSTFKNDLKSQRISIKNITCFFFFFL